MVSDNQQAGGMSLAVASPQFGFGYRPQVPGGLRFSDEQTILFAAGNQIARLNLEQKTMKFVPGSEICQKITSVALSPNNRYLAVSEKTHDDKAQIIIYDLMTDTPKKRKVLTREESETKLIKINRNTDY
ncbi:Oidioi.mRNA.OKI2018_I69.chr1.g2666.t1.cds [Oikopleura dioica]|uniref:Oidioi.mRNA.OKI2018_I69.chr1.g2666.t1.cds n=1 Tax=Oikopleura dioica TaxID=34765 RepID=A0ABN7SX73_OIKDI|nr:Oidioi.mRNA.OKI2018_I69.chr1.g2666.t1.cds [Oikopleura dioica]